MKTVRKAQRGSSSPAQNAMKRPSKEAAYVLNAKTREATVGSCSQAGPGSCRSDGEEASADSILVRSARKPRGRISCRIGHWRSVRVTFLIMPAATKSDRPSNQDGLLAYTL